MCTGSIPHGACKGFSSFQPLSRACCALDTACSAHARRVLQEERQRFPRQHLSGPFDRPVAPRSSPHRSGLVSACPCCRQLTPGPGRNLKDRTRVSCRSPSLLCTKPWRPSFPTRPYCGRRSTMGTGRDPAVHQRPAVSTSRQREQRRLCIAHCRWCLLPRGVHAYCCAC